MSTELQKNLAQNIVKNAKRKKPLNKKELLVISGYSPISAEASATEIIEQKGVREELDNLGFSVENAKRVIGEILDDRRIKPETRIRAAHEVLAVHGEYAPEKHIVITKKIVSVDE